MKRDNILRTASMLIAALFLISFAAAVSEAAQKATKIKGTVVAIDADAGILIVQQDSGETVTLRAATGIDLKICKIEDQVSVELDSDNVIQSLHVSPK